MSLRADVRKFHEAFGLPVSKTPAVPSAPRVRLRLNLIAEEFIELLEAHGLPVQVIKPLLHNTIDSFDPVTDKVDFVEVADALGDLDYVIEGYRQEAGINGEKVHAEIQRSNMSKLGEDGKPIYRDDGKAMKGPNFSPPDIAAVLRRQGWDG